MKSTSHQHVQVPNKIGANADTNSKKLLPVDYYVYSCLRKYMNKNTYQTFTGLSTIARDTNTSIVSIRSSINRLIESEDIKKIINPLKRSNTYEFNKDSDKFEMFTLDFLDIDFLSPTEKGIFIALQKYMYKDGSNMMVTTYTFEELAEKSGIPVRSIYRAFKTYKQNNVSNTMPTRVKDPVTGILRQAKMIDLGSVCQAVLFVNERVDGLEIKFNKLLEDNKRMQEQLDKLAQLQLNGQLEYKM